MPEPKMPTCSCLIRRMKPFHGFWFRPTGLNTGGSTGRDWWFQAALRLSHDADAAVQLTLGVVVVDVGIGVAQAHIGRGRRRGAARVVGAAVLDQDVCALLAARPPGVGQRRLATGVPTLHVHPVLRGKIGGTPTGEQVRLFILYTINKWKIWHFSAKKIVSIILIKG